MYFKVCKRCGDKAFEQLKTHSYCVNCNYSPDTDIIRNTSSEKEFQTFERRNKASPLESQLFIERVIWQSVSQGLIPEVKAQISNSQGKLQVEIKPLNNSLDEMTKKEIQKILVSQIKKDAYICRLYLDFKFLNQ